MNDPNKIQVGDMVHVDFNCAKFTLCHAATVMSMPCATGDSWVFSDSETGQIHYVSEGCTVSKLDT